MEIKILGAEVNLPEFILQFCRFQGHATDNLFGPQFSLL